MITNLAQLSLGTNAFLAGALVLPGALIGAFFAPIGGTLYDRFGPVRPILGAFFLAICGPILLLVFSMRLTPATLAGFYFIFGLGYALGFSNIMTNALRSIAPQFMPDGNAVFNTCLQFGGAAGTALFSTVLSVAQPAQARKEPSIQPCHGGWRQLDVHRHDRDCRRCNLLPDYRLPHRRETQITVFSPSASPLWAQFCSPSLRSGRL